MTTLEDIEKAVAELPPDQLVRFRALANKNYALLKENPRHPSLRFKKVGRFWSVRVGTRYRALAVEVDAGLLWFWVGSHSDYDAMT